MKKTFNNNCRLIFRNVLIIIFCVVLIASVSFCGIFLQESYAKKAGNRNKDFWKKPGDADIWFVGSSHFYYGVSPMQLWNEFGLKTYDLTYPSVSPPVSYWMIKCALKKGKPKLIFLDTYHLQAENKIEAGNILKRHVLFDEIPKSSTKIAMANDLFKKKKDRRIYGLGLQKGKYANNKYNSSEIFKYSKGSDVTPRVADYRKLVNISRKKMLKKETTAIKYTHKIIKLCKQKKIKIVLTAFPFYGVEKDRQMGLNTTGKIAKKFHIPYIDIKSKGIVNIKTDMADSGHANPVGCQKMTNYMGEYIRKNYKFPDYRKKNNKNTKSWNKSFQNYTKFRESQIKKSSSIRECLLWATDDNHKILLYRKNTKATKQSDKIDNEIIKFLENAKYLEQITYEEAVKYNNGKEFNKDYWCVVFTNKKSGKIVYKVFFNEKKSTVIPINSITAPVGNKHLNKDNKKKENINTGDINQEAKSDQTN